MTSPSNAVSTPVWYAHYEELGIVTPPFEDRPFGSYIEEHAQKRPDSSAMWYVARHINYAEFNSETNRLANVLTDLGVKKGDVVGIHLPNTPQYMIALAAISKLGATGSGVSPLLAPKEIAFQIEDARIKVLLTLVDLTPAVQAMPETPQCLETVIVTDAMDYLSPKAFDLPDISGATVKAYLALMTSASTEFQQIETHWNDTYMIQYTGGTTGRAKGAMLSHRNIMYNTAQTSAMSIFEPGEETLMSAFPLFHIAGLSIAINSVRHGGMMILVPNPRDTDFICAQLEKFPPTFIAAVPALYDMMVANPKFASVDFSRLKAALTGAAPLTRSSYDAVSNIIGAGKVSDIFGMTETGPCYTTNPPKRYKSGSVGIPLPNVTIRIRDVETGEKDMPTGEPGEIISAGPQVMKGYLNLPEETDNALRDIDGRKWMFSGDVGYMDEEGYIFLCDRAKDMLIVGGYKVFSVEVEDKLSAMPEIAACAVIGQKDEARPGNDIVTLYVELSPDHKNANTEVLHKSITQFCRDNMAAYKVPKQIHFVDAIPLTPVGKIDKKALRA
jgi:long-chain acyl-CoA synthetase